MSTTTNTQYPVSSKQWTVALKDFLQHAIVQTRILKKAYPGIMHLLIFWGVTIQVIGTAINLMQMALFTPFALENFPRGNIYFAYELIMDLAGVFILVGVLMAVIRRLVMRPKSLPTAWDDYYALAILTVLPIFGFFAESMRLISSAPEWAQYSFVGNWLARMLYSAGLTPQAAFNAQPFLVLTHIFLGLTFAASIPFTKLRHLVMAPLNVILKPERPYGALTKIEDIEEIETLGVGQIIEFSPNDLLAIDACLRCGRCEEVCPATFSGLDYSPRTLLMDLRDAMIDSIGGVQKNGNGSGEKELPAHLFEEEALWSCTTCGACLTRCPAFIRPPERVVDLRRYQILMTGEMPKPVGDTLRNLERQGNPWGMPPQDRMKWAEGLEVRELAPNDEVDVLLYMGCAAAFDDRNKKVSQSVVRLLQKAEVDFGVLGFDEACCGETARRMGHEYIFQVFAEQNIEIFESVKFNRIVTQCPHCFNTLKNEYPQMGGEYEVLHYSELLKEVSEQGVWEYGSNGDAHQLAFHDSCYLGRYNDIYSAPRQVLDQANVDRVELARQGENSFCCGAGGGGMWIETDADKRINQRRLQDALDANVDTVATACPYCLIMFEDAITSKGIGEDVKVMDIAEVLEKQVKS